MSKAKNLIFQDQRLVILTSLLECGYDANENILLDCLSLYGHRISQDLIRSHLLFLEEHGLITIEKISDDVLWVAYLTRRGEDVAKGVARCDGVRKPHSNF